MTVGSYDHLEQRGDEAFTTASIHQLHALGRVVQRNPAGLLLGPEAEDRRQTVTFRQVVERLAHHLQASGQTAEEFGDAVGWDITSLLETPESLWGHTVEALRDICSSVGIDWVDALPDAETLVETST
jgi:hypothetical protein